MGLLCDLFVSTDSEARSYEAVAKGERAILIEKYAPTEFKGLTSLEFGTLWAILLGEEWDVDRHMLIDVAFGEGNESWLHQFQSEYVALLTKLDETTIDRVSDLWGRTEALSCASSDVRPVIEALARLSRQAVGESKGLYMWGSL
jgi:hypothetical protein